MSIKAIALAAVVAVSSTSAFAVESLVAQQDVHGRSVFTTTALLAEQGIKAVGVEEWGDAIRVESVDDQGATKVVIVDKSTLRPIAG